MNADADERVDRRKKKKRVMKRLQRERKSLKHFLSEKMGLRRRATCSWQFFFERLELNVINRK